MFQPELDQFLGQVLGLTVSLAGGNHNPLLAANSTPHPNDRVAIKQGWANQNVIGSGLIPSRVDPAYSNADLFQPVGGANKAVYMDAAKTEVIATLQKIPTGRTVVPTGTFPF